MEFGKWWNRDVGINPHWISSPFPELYLAASMRSLRRYPLLEVKIRSRPHRHKRGSEHECKSFPLKATRTERLLYFWKQALQKDIKMKKAQGIKPHDVVPGLQVIRDIYNLPRIPVDSEGGCLCYYCEKHTKRARREKFFKLPRYFCILVFCYKLM